MEKEVFDAVDKALGLTEGFDRETAVAMMDGHVVGCGEMTGSYKKGSQ